MASSDLSLVLRRLAAQSRAQQNAAAVLSSQVLGGLQQLQELQAQMAVTALEPALAAAAASAAAANAAAASAAAVAVTPSTIPAAGASGGAGATVATGAAASSASPTAPAAAPPPATPPPAAVEEVPRCHLHRKQSKACRFCKSYAQFQELRNKELEEKKNAAIARLKHSGARGGGALVNQDDKVAIPNFVHFSQTWRERIINGGFYQQVLANQEVSALKDGLFECETAEPEVRGRSSLDAVPSPFICAVYRMMTIKLTEGQLRSLLSSRTRWVRCAGFVYIRLGVHQDRYWELLSEFLMDDEEFVPFPGRSSDSMTEGQFVEQLLTKEKLCDLPLPRIAAAQRRTINERMVFYDQFRKRYGANLEVIDRYETEKLDVEVCGVDGEWREAVTTGPPVGGRRRVVVPVRYLNGETESVSIGMVICPSKGTSSSTSSTDLTRTRGRSNRELLEEYREQQRDAAVASGKDYCKTSGRHIVHAGGVTFSCGGKRRREEEEEKSKTEDAEEKRAREAKRREPSMEQQAKMQAIVEKYCARPSGAASTSRSNHKPLNENMEHVDRMRLG